MDKVEEAYKRRMLQEMYESAEQEKYLVTHPEEQRAIMDLNKEWYNKASAQGAQRRIYTPEEEKLLGGPELSVSDKIKRAMALEEAKKSLGLPVMSDIKN